MTAQALKPALRRTPHRRSSKQIVDSILDAASELLKEGRLERVTTNQIATRAGISIGSLYQYFPNKQAVLSSLATRLEQRTLELFMERMSSFDGRSLEEMARSVIELMSTEQLGPAQLRRELLAHVPRACTEDVSRHVDGKVAAALAAQFCARAEVRPGCAEMMAFVILYSVEAVIEAAVLRRRDLIGSPALIDELIRLVTGYLTG